jgi:hypothetical protein
MSKGERLRFAFCWSELFRRSPAASWSRSGMSVIQYLIDWVVSRSSKLIMAIAMVGRDVKTVSDHGEPKKNNVWVYPLSLPVEMRMWAFHYLWSVLNGAPECQCIVCYTAGLFMMHDDEHIHRCARVDGQLRTATCWCWSNPLFIRCQYCIYRFSLPFGCRTCLHQVTVSHSYFRNVLPIFPCARRVPPGPVQHTLSWNIRFNLLLKSVVARVYVSPVAWITRKVWWRHKSLEWLSLFIHKCWNALRNQSNWNQIGIFANIQKLTFSICPFDHTTFHFILLFRRFACLCKWPKVRFESRPHFRLIV